MVDYGPNIKKGCNWKQFKKLSVKSKMEMQLYLALNSIVV